jgi:hypothetical protein
VGDRTNPNDRKMNGLLLYLLIPYPLRGLAESCTVNLGLVSMNYIFHERNWIYLHGEDKVQSKFDMCPQRIFVFHFPKYVDQM